MDEPPHSSTSASRGTAGTGGFLPPTIEELNRDLPSYEVIEMLGCGGMGAVFKARQPNLNRIVAIKILPLELGADGLEYAERFKREAQALARLNHPNIVSVYDFGQTSLGQLYFVMEFVEGTDLHKVIRSGQAGTEHVLGWVPQICEALQYAHSKGIIHRDIKPANILIDLEGTVKVADFGLAKLAGDDIDQPQLTMTNMAMGTPDYVAPETLEMGVIPDHRADIYAIGVILYEMLTGKVPRGAYRTPSEKIPGLDERYDDLICEAMDADRDTRIQHANEISARLWEIATQPVEDSEDSLSNPRGREVTLLTGSETDHRSGPAAAGNRSQNPRAPSKAKPLLIVSLLTVLLIVVGLAFFLRGDGDETDPVSIHQSATVDGGEAKPLVESVPRPVSKPDPIPSPKPTAAVAAVPPVTASIAPRPEESKTPPSGESRTGLELAELLSSSKWTTPAPVTVDLGQDVAEHYSPFLSPDGKHLFLSLWYEDAKTEVFQFSLTDDPQLINAPVRLKPEINSKLNEKGFCTALGGTMAVVWRIAEKAEFSRLEFFRLSSDESFTRESDSFIDSPGDASNNVSPSLSEDGLHLIFVSQTPGNTDLWTTSRRSVDEPFDPPILLGPEVNTAKLESSCKLSQDGLLLLFSRGGDLYYSVRESLSAPFGLASPIAFLDSPSQGESPNITSDGRLLYFLSRRDIPNGKLRLFVSSRIIETGSQAPIPALTSAPALTAAPESKEPPPPTSEAATRIAELFSKYETGYRSTMVAPHEAAVAKLNASYVAALTREQANLTKAGDLDGVVTFRDEITRVETGRALPQSDDELPEPLANLRKIYRQQTGELEENLQSKGLGLITPFKNELAALEIAFTKGGHVDAALEVRKVSENLESAGLPFLAVPLSATEPLPAEIAPAPTTLPPSGQLFGRLRAYSKIKEGTNNSEMDISETADMDDFIQVKILDRGRWGAIRKDGTVVSNDPLLKNVRDAVDIFAKGGVLRKDGRFQTEVDGKTLRYKNVVKAMQVAAAGAVLLSDGTIEVWGRNSGGETVLPDNDRADYIQFALPWGMMERKDTSPHQAYAVRSDGSVVLWGNLSKPSELPDKIKGIVDLKSGWNHFIALSSNGEVQSWPKRSQASKIPESLGKVIAIQADSNISAAQKEDLSWVAWGDDGMGVVEKINSLGPAIKIDFTSNASGCGYLLWIEPTALPLR